MSAPALLRPWQMMLEITSAAWQFITWRSRRQPRQGSAGDGVQLAHVAPENDCRNDPRVDAARIPPNTSVMAPLGQVPEHPVDQLAW